MPRRGCWRADRAQVSALPVRRARPIDVLVLRGAAPVIAALDSILQGVRRVIY